MSTQIMQSVQENDLFFEMSAEESAKINGGGFWTGFAQAQLVGGLITPIGRAVFFSQLPNAFTA